MHPQEFIKAIVGGVVAGLTAFGTALDDGVTGVEWIGVAIATVITFGSIYGAPANAEPTPPAHR